MTLYKGVIKVNVKLGSRQWPLCSELCPQIPCPPNGNAIAGYLTLRGIPPGPEMRPPVAVPFYAKA